MSLDRFVLELRRWPRASRSPRVGEAIKGPDFQNVYNETGSEFVGDTPENFARFIEAEAAKWARVVKESGATVD